MIMLLEYLQTLGLKVPIVFMNYSTRMMLAALTSLLICILLGPKFIKKLYEMKVGQTIRTEECPLLGELHHKKKDTPTMGGILILTALITSLFLWMDLRHPFTILLLITTLFLGFLGGIDDYLKLRYKNTKGLSGKKKLFGQVLLSSCIALYLLVPSISESLHSGKWFDLPTIKIERTESIVSPTNNVTTVKIQKNIPFQDYINRLYIPFFKGSVISFSGFFSIITALLIVFVITGSSNAVNLTDGLDGLAAGCLIFASMCFAFVAFVSNNADIAFYLNIPYVEGSGEIAIYLSAFAGGCLGFLWYNGHPAQVFMGDVGSLSLGGILGLSAILLKKELLLGIVGGIFVLEALSVILQVTSYKFRNKKRIFLCSPLHHHFEYKGWPETKVVLRFWIVGFLLALIGLASLKFQ